MEKEIKHIKHYRYEDTYFNEEIILALKMFVAIKETPKGYWIIPKSDYIFGLEFDVEFDDFNESYFVLKESKRRFAYPTKEEAIENFMFRKKKQLGILESQKIKAKKTLDIAKEKYPDIYKKVKQKIGINKIIKSHCQ